MARYKKNKQNHIELTGRSKAKSTRAKLQDAVLVVPSKSQKYRKILYIFNFILFGLGLSLISMACCLWVWPDKFMAPEWLAWWFISLGVFQCILGSFAARGAVLAKKKIESGRRNHYLNCFIVFMSLLFLFETTVMFVVIVKTADVDQEQLQTVSDTMVDEFEGAMKRELERRKDFWWDMQKTWECCGWKNNTIPDPLATGKFCTTNTVTSYQSCAELFGDFFTKNLVFVIIFAVVFGLSQCAVCCSACQLGCRIQAQEPVYSSHF